jgi:hypothetical protein
LKKVRVPYSVAACRVANSHHLTCVKISRSASDQGIFAFSSSNFFIALSLHFFYYLVLRLDQSHLLLIGRSWEGGRETSWD